MVPDPTPTCCTGKKKKRGKFLHYGTDSRDQLLAPPPPTAALVANGGVAARSSPGIPAPNRFNAELIFSIIRSPLATGLC